MIPLFHLLPILGRETYETKIVEKFIKVYKSITKVSPLFILFKTDAKQKSINFHCLGTRAGRWTGLSATKMYSVLVAFSCS